MGSEHHGNHLPDLATFLDRWVAGAPVHDAVRGVCTPDFSCCVPALLADREERELYRAANPELRRALELVWLRRALSSHFYGGGTIGTSTTPGGQ